MSAFPPPELPLTDESPRKRWPLWAKIAAPLGALMVVGGIANAISPPQDDTQSVSSATVPTTEVAPLDSSTTTSFVVNVTTSSVAAATTPPETTTAPTPPPTAAPTIAPTNPPATSPPPPPPTNPPATAPPPPPLPIAAPIAANDPDFGTCKEAKANGYGPYYRGVDPEYDWYRDADSDGIVCE